MSKQIKVYSSLIEDEIEIFIPKDLLKDYLLGEESLIFTLSPLSAAELRAQLNEHA